MTMHNKKYDTVGSLKCNNHLLQTIRMSLITQMLKRQKIISEEKETIRKSHITLHQYLIYIHMYICTHILPLFQIKAKATPTVKCISICIYVSIFRVYFSYNII